MGHFFCCIYILYIYIGFIIVLHCDKQRLVRQKLGVEKHREDGSFGIHAGIIAGLGYRLGKVNVEKI